MITTKITKVSGWFAYRLDVFKDGVIFDIFEFTPGRDPIWIDLKRDYSLTDNDLPA